MLLDTESWHILSSPSTVMTCGRSSSTGCHGDLPPARHKHSSILHDDAMWVYGGMTDLQERADFWRWDTGKLKALRGGVEVKLHEFFRHWHSVISKGAAVPRWRHAVCDSMRDQVKEFFLWRCMWEWRYNSTLFFTLALDGSKWSGTCLDRFTPEER
jgi:hypothetical protein